jgi:hypothetical protein
MQPRPPSRGNFHATVNRAPNFHVLGASTFIFSATRNRKLLILFERRYHAKHQHTMIPNRCPLIYVDAYSILSRFCRFCLECGRQVPGQELADAVDRMLSDAGEHLAQIERGIKPVQLRSADQSVKRRGTHTAGIGAEEQVVLPTDGDGAQRSLGGAVVDLEQTIVDVARKSTLVRECVPNRASCSWRTETATSSPSSGGSHRESAWSQSRTCRTVSYYLYLNGDESGSHPSIRGWTVHWF